MTDSNQDIRRAARALGVHLANGRPNFSQAALKWTRGREVLPADSVAPNRLDGANGAKRRVRTLNGSCSGGPADQAGGGSGGLTRAMEVGLALARGEVFPCRCSRLACYARTRDSGLSVFFVLATCASARSFGRRSRTLRRPCG